jgi:hypothetical protein
MKDCEPLDDKERSELAELRIYWSDLAKKIHGNSLDSIENASKQLISTAGILIGLYSSVLGFSDLDKSNLPLHSIVLYCLPLFFWLISLASAVLVFWHSSHNLYLNQSAQIKREFDNILNGKQRLLQVAGLFLVAGVLFIVLVVFFLFD